MSNLLPYYMQGRVEAGCDEAGRGCLAGPVVAAAVIMPEDIDLPELNDSKKLSKQQRITLRKQIEESAIDWAVGWATPQEIDEINILWASFLAMHRAIDQLKKRPEFLLIDGNRFKTYQQVPHLCVVKGDGKYRSIAAASVLAKTYRDEYMHDLYNIHPVYDWKQNMGYPTIKHRAAIAIHGLTEHHRKTFRWQDPQLKLEL